MTLVAVLANSIALGIVQFSVLTHSTILMWLAITNGLSVVRFGLYLKFNRLSSEQQVPNLIYGCHVLPILFMGVMFYLMGVMFYPNGCHVLPQCFT
jgi:hypothetical protein